MKPLIFKIFTNVLYSLVTIMLIFKKSYKFKILSDEETLKKILINKVSIARFGDGEFNGVLGKKLAGFQDRNLLLERRLREILSSNNSYLMIGIPRGLIDVSEYSRQVKKFWRIYSFKNRKKLFPHFGNGTFVNSSFTRPYIDYENYNKVKERFDTIKKIWDSRKIVIVEGTKTKFGVGNDLINNAIEVRRILCPPKNAFDSYDEIYEAIIKNVSVNELVLISLGPTATILSYDLAKVGYQSIDIGHLDVEYEWYLQGSKEKIPLRGKNVNEVKDDLSDLEILDNKYRESILLNLDNEVN